MDIHSLIKTTGLIAISFSSVFFCSYSIADINASTNSEDRFWINRTHKNLDKIHYFKATSEQTSPGQASPIVSKITFKKPDNFYQRITRPELIKDSQARYSNNTIALYDASNNQALTIKGLSEPKASSARLRVKGIYLYNKEHYHQEFTPSIHIAERLSVGIDFSAKEKNAKIKKIEGFADYHYSLFMQANYLFNDGPTVKIKNTDIEFNTSNDFQEEFNLPDIELPKGTKIISWDFNQEHLSAKKIREKINKNIVWPEDENNTWDFSEHKYYQQKDNKHAAAYYHNDGFFLITTTQPNHQAIKDSSPNESESLSQKPGIVLTLSKTQVVLNQLPTFSTLDFVHNHIHYTLLSNIHPESLLSMATGIIAAQ